MKGIRDRLLAASGATVGIIAGTVVVGVATQANATVVGFVGGVATAISTFDIIRGGDKGRVWSASSIGRVLSVVRRIIRHGSGTGVLAAAAGWRMMCLAARLMPRAVGRRWLAEAESFLAEAPPELRRRAINSYLATAPQVIVVGWASEAARRLRIIGDEPR